MPDSYSGDLGANPGAATEILKTKGSGEKMKQDLAHVVFATDPRVLRRAREKYELSESASQEQLAIAAEDLRKVAERGVEPEAGWLREARLLGERVGKPWYETPERTLVEALADREGLRPVAFPVTMIAAGARAMITTQPQVCVRGRRLVLDESAAPHLLVNCLVIGKNYQFLNTEPLPGSLFAPSAFPVPLKLDTCQVSQIITLGLTNVSGAMVQVGAVILGQWVETARESAREYALKASSPQSPLHHTLMPNPCRDILRALHRRLGSPGSETFDRSVTFDPESIAWLLRFGFIARGPDGELVLTERGMDERVFYGE